MSELDLTNTLSEVGQEETDQNAVVPAGAEGQGEVEQEAVAPDEGESEAPQMIPYKQYERIYAKAKEADREVQYLRAQLAGGEAASQPRAAPAPAAAPVSGQDRLVSLVQQALAPLVNPVLEESRLAKAARVEAEFWSKPENSAFADLRPEVSRIFNESIRAGQPTDPELILDALYGRRQRLSSAARREVTRASVTQTKTSNATARAETGATATSKPTSKSPDEMTPAEFEAAFGNVTVYRGR